MILTAILGFGLDEFVEFIKVHGNTILTILQVVGIFFCGMTGKFRLGAMLCLTVLLTILWGW